MELLIGSGSRAERHVVLPTGETLIGRCPDCQIVLDAPAIGPRHARVFSVNGRTVLYAISPQWPVYVNGDAVERRILVHDDDIELAHYHLRFVDEPSNAPAEIVDVLELLTKPEEPVPANEPLSADEPPSAREDTETVSLQVDGANPPPLPPETSGGAFHLDILTGINRGRRLALERGSVVLGFNGERLLELRNRDNELMARDVATGLNAFLNGHPIGDSFRVLGPGDVLSVQRIDMRVGQDAGQEDRD